MLISVVYCTACSRWSRTNSTLVDPSVAQDEDVCRVDVQIRRIDGKVCFCPDEKKGSKLWIAFRCDVGSGPLYVHVMRH